MKIFLSILFIAILAVASTILYFYNEVKFEADRLIHYNPELSTQIFDRKNRLIANIFDKQHRLYAKYNEIPAQMVEALLAVEDTMFFEHYGVNVEAIMRAIIKDIKAGALVEGASTLTQQLIKTALLTRKKEFSRKIKEVLLAVELEFLLTKEQILERYLNHIYLGHGYYGVKTASIGYFHKNLDELSLKEIAMLVSLPKAPSYYSPTKNYDKNIKRANSVLYRMYSIGWINDSELKSAIKERPVVFDESLSQNIAPYITDMVIKELSREYADLRTGGYKIYLTVDLDIQALAKKSLKSAYKKIKLRDRDGKYTDGLNGAMSVLESGSGELLAVVGGVDYRESSFNRATQARRQPGSSFKPFIYQLALDLGYAPSSMIADISRTYKYETDSEEEKVWQPKNYEKNYKGLISLRDALVHSRNLATINLVEDIGLNNVYSNLINRYGFDSSIPQDLSISLGSFGISVLELSKLYTLFSNYGTVVEPFFIKKIENRFSEIKTFNTTYEKITKEEQAYLMVSILRDVVKRGTARGINLKEIEIAGKTGTTNNNVDAWFCSFSPTIQVISWFGNDNNSRMKKSETGSRAAGTATKEFFKEFIEKYPTVKREFEIPENVITREIDGVQKLFTPTSKPPKVDLIQEDKLIF